jgi:hypothetical protein
MPGIMSAVGICTQMTQLAGCTPAMEDLPQVSEKSNVQTQQPDSCAGSCKRLARQTTSTFQAAMGVYTDT